MIKEGNYRQNKKTGKILRRERIILICDICGKEWLSAQEVEKYLSNHEKHLCRSCVAREIGARPNVKKLRSKASLAIANNSKYKKRQSLLMKKKTC